MNDWQLSKWRAHEDQVLREEEAARQDWYRRQQVALQKERLRVERKRIEQQWAATMGGLSQSQAFGVADRMMEATGPGAPPDSGAPPGSGQGGGGVSQITGEEWNDMTPGERRQYISDNSDWGRRYIDKYGYRGLRDGGSGGGGSGGGGSGGGDSGGGGSEYEELTPEERRQRSREGRIENLKDLVWVHNKLMEQGKYEEADETAHKIGTQAHKWDIDYSEFGWDVGWDDGSEHEGLTRKEINQRIREKRVKHLQDRTRVYFDLKEMGKYEEAKKTIQDIREKAKMWNIKPREFGWD
jgi:hypothetical protein